MRYRFLRDVLHSTDYYSVERFEVLTTVLLTFQALLRRYAVSTDTVTDSAKHLNESSSRRPD